MRISTRITSFCTNGQLKLNACLLYTSQGVKSLEELLLLLTKLDVDNPSNNNNDEQTHKQFQPQQQQQLQQLSLIHI